jgi:Protein of unknown function (DUF664)
MLERMPWTAPQITRQNVPYVAGERHMLEAWLDFHRQTLPSKCGGLTAAQLRMRAAPPSNLSLLGLIRHMTEVERGWFRRRIAGEDVGYLYSSEADPSVAPIPPPSARSLCVGGVPEGRILDARSSWRADHNRP